MAFFEQSVVCGCGQTDRENCALVAAYFRSGSLRIAMKKYISLALGMFCVASSGCWATRADLQAQELRLQTLESGLEEERKQLETVLNDASSVIRRNSADQGQQIEGLQRRMDGLEGKIAESKHATKTSLEEQNQRSEAFDNRLNDIARAAGMDVALSADEIPKRKTAHFEAGEKALRQGDFARSRAFFMRFIERFPTDDLVDNAKHSIGVSYLKQGRPASALSEFKKVLSDHRKGDVVDRTLFSMSDAFYELRSCDDAIKALEALQKSQRKSALIKDSKKRVAEIKAAGAAYCN